MRFVRPKHHTDGLVTLLLFGVFAACVLSVLLTGAKVYRDITAGNRREYSRRTCAQYIVTKVRQAPSGGGVDVSDNAINLRETIDGEDYVTSIYCHDGWLWEEKYPERRVTVVDSLAASAGYGLLLYLCVKMRDDGADADALKAFAEDIRLKICHWFTVDDLVYLKRGGRVSAATALAGAVLGIKPILHVDDEGHLINMAKIRGRKASVRAIAKKFGELYDPSAKEKTPFSDTIFISHADCPADAKELESILSEEYGFRTELITDIGPVIGAHSGPGTLALFFVGKSR